MHRAHILTTPPVVAPIAQMSLINEGIVIMANWVKDRRPECLPDNFNELTEQQKVDSLFPHSCTRPPSEPTITLDAHPRISGNELLVELTGRKCYDSFGLKAGQKTNADYIANTQRGDIPHASIMYHAKMSFFIGGISRRVSHELIRHYVGADRTEEGSPSQESTRYVEHAGRYIAHPNILDNKEELQHFSDDMTENYTNYLKYIERRRKDHRERTGEDPKGLERKRIFESASPYLAHSCETSFIWTTNPIALAKLLRERCNESADLEFQRLGETWKEVALATWPNLFCQPWLR